MSRSRDLANLAGDATGLETLTVSDITDLTATAAELNKLDGVTASTAELNKLTGVTADTNELNLLDGVTATTAELNYTDGVSSALQTQINAKAPIASPTFTGTTTVADFVPATPLSHRNLIINGGMQVWQRGTSATTVSQDYNTVDRWKMFESTDGAYTSEKHIMSLAEFNTTGHASALKLTPTTADPDIESSQYAYITQYIEAQNCQHLQYGTANAKTITLSFWVKSNVTGTWTLNVTKRDSTVTIYVKEYTINSADTWEKKEITITPTAGSTSFITSSGGEIANDNGVGLEISFNLGYGSTWNGGTTDTWNQSNKYSTTNHSTTASFMANTSNTFYLTGVQLEVGSVATPFEHKSYGEELQRCQRYYWRMPNNKYVFSIIDGNGTYVAAQFHHPVRMRATPAVGLLHKGAFYWNPSGSGQTNATPNGSTTGFSGGDEHGGLAYVSGSNNLGGLNNDQITGQWFCRWEFRAELE